MSTPRRGTIIAIIFFVFLFLFFGGLFYYLYPVFFENVDSETEDVTNDETFTFFPFGRDDSGSQPRPDTDVDSEVDQEEQDSEEDGQVVLPRLRQITDVPTAGATFAVDTATGTDENTDLLDDSENDLDQNYIIRYIESETGNLYGAESNNLDVKRLTNTTIPGVVSANFVSLDNPILRYLDSNGNIKTYSARYTAPLVESDGVGRLQGVFLDDNIQRLTISEDNQLFYVLHDGGTSNGIISDTDGREKTKIFSSEYSEWNPSFGQRNQTVAMTTYPSYEAFGLSYLFNINTQSFTPYLSGEKSLMVSLNQNGDRAVASFWDGNSMDLYIKKGQESFIETGVQTFAQKCVWASDAVTVYCAVPSNDINNNEPDLWYQGVTSYTDSFVKINTDTASVEFVYSPFSSNGYRLDVTSLKISPNDQYLYFIDKANRFLWSLYLFNEA